LAKWFVGQGNTPEKALDKLKQAIESLGELYKSESEVDIRPISIN
jgi:predicted RNase H-like HicB family nuclease